MDGDKTSLEEEGAQQETSCGHAAGVGTIVGLSGGGLHNCSSRVDGCLEVVHSLVPSPFSCGSAPLSSAKSGRILARKGLGRRSPGLSSAISVCCTSHDSGTSLRHLPVKKYTKKEGVVAPRGAPRRWISIKGLATSGVFVAIGNADCVLEWPVQSRHENEGEKKPKKIYGGPGFQGRGVEVCPRGPGRGGHLGSDGAVDGPLCGLVCVADVDSQKTCNWHATIQCKARFC